MEVLDYDHYLDENEVIFITYVGFVTQTLLAGMIDSLEHEQEFSDIPRGTAHNIFTIFIEVTQNIIKYAKSELLKQTSYKSNGLIVIGKTKENQYFIHSQNLVAKKDVDLITKRIEMVKKLTPEEIKQKYRELRRSGENSHECGAGIGFFEIAKRAKEMNYKFKKIGENKYYFYLTIEIKD